MYEESIWIKGSSVHKTSQEKTDMNNEERIEKQAQGALVFGILSLIFGCIPLIGIITSIAGLYLSMQYKTNGGEKMLSKARAGKVCAIIGLCLSLTLIIVTIIRAIFKLY